MTSLSWSEVSALQSRTDLPQLLSNHLEELRADDLPHALCRSWVMPEWPGLLLDHQEWDDIFSYVLGDNQYLRERDIRPVSELPDQMILFRAATPGHERGMSWTSNFQRAYWFLTRFGDHFGRHRLYMVTANPQMVWAHFDEERNENEYVLKHHSLEGSDMEEVMPEEWQYLMKFGPTDEINPDKETTDARA